VHTRAGQFGRGVLLIDLVGVAVVSLCSFAVYSLATAQAHRSSQTIPGLQAQSNQSAQDVHRLTSACQRQRTEMAATQEVLDRTGLPQSTPVEVYLQAIATLASENQIRVVEQHPLSPVSYPGLLEQRCAYGVSGRATNLIAFLYAVEQAPYWADISYLSIQSDSGTDLRQTAEHTARLTFSLFSHIPAIVDKEKD